MPIPEQIELYYADQTPPLRCASPGELVEVLHAMHRRVDPEYPIRVVVGLPRHSVCIGLGSDPTFVEIHADPYEGYYHTATGDLLARGSKVFYWSNQPVSFQARCLVSWDLALSAVLEFVTHQKRAASISWESMGHSASAVASGDECS